MYHVSDYDYRQHTLHPSRTPVPTTTMYVYVRIEFHLFSLLAWALFWLMRSQIVVLTIFSLAADVITSPFLIVPRKRKERKKKLPTHCFMIDLGWEMTTTIFSPFFSFSFFFPRSRFFLAFSRIIVRVVYSSYTYYFISISTYVYVYKLRLRA